MLQYEFMRNALYAILIITPLFGIIGTVIVNNKMAFFSDALGHSALTGIAIGAILGIILIVTKIKKSNEYIPFGPFIVAAILLLFLLKIDLQMFTGLFI